MEEEKRREKKRSMEEEKKRKHTGRRGIGVNARREVLHERVVEDCAPVAQLEVVQAARGFVARRGQCGALQESARGADAAQAVPVAHRHQRLLSGIEVYRDTRTVYRSLLL